MWEEPLQFKRTGLFLMEQVLAKVKIATSQFPRPLVMDAIVFRTCLRRLGSAGYALRSLRKPAGLKVSLRPSAGIPRAMAKRLPEKSIRAKFPKMKFSGTWGPRRGRGGERRPGVGESGE